MRSVALLMAAVFQLVASSSIASEDSRQRLHAALAAKPSPTEREGWSETPGDRSKRIRVIVDANFQAANKLSDAVIDRSWLVAINIATQWHESKFSREVHAGGRGRWGSDNGRAKCLGQIHASRLVPPAEWEELGGIDAAASERCANAGMRLFNALAKMCRFRPTEDRIKAILWAYASGKGCNWKNAPESWQAQLQARLTTVRELYDVIQGGQV